MAVFRKSTFLQPLQGIRKLKDSQLRLSSLRNEKKKKKKKAKQVWGGVQEEN